MLDFAPTQGQLLALEYVLIGLALVILVCSIDDLFIDLFYWKERLLGRGRRGAPPAPGLDRLRQEPERPIAIMVPAWKESEVIAAMIENMVRVLDYRQYDVFVGTYVNDPPTVDQVERMRRRYPHVHRVEVPHPGPTCKADCLNVLVHAIVAHEKRADVQFAGVVLHDSEDVLNPLELRYFNAMLARHDMIQVPVISLRRAWRDWVGSTYMDEFAEVQKEMVVRERLTGSVPSAGVGTCFSRKALAALMRATRNQPFNIRSVTEDYDVGMRLAGLGMHSTFGWLDLEPPRLLRARPLHVAEFFPDRFSTAVRQRARWMLGIGLLSWKQIPLRGRSAASKYMLLHDRKGIVTAFVPALAYLLTVVLLAVGSSGRPGWALPHFSGPSTQPWFEAVLAANVALVMSRLAHRFYFTARLYGWHQGLLSWPRMVVGNFVNCFAVGRAWRLFLGHRILGHRLTWDKTTHDYPSAAELGRPRQRLGELLVSWRALQPEQLEHALDRQRLVAHPLGRLLVEDGAIDEDLLADAIACQADLPRGAVVASQARACRSKVPARLAFRRRFVPLAVVQGGRLLVGVASPLPSHALKEIGAATGLEPIQRIIRDSEVGASLDFVFREELAKAGTHDPAQDKKVAGQNG